MTKGDRDIEKQTEKSVDRSENGKGGTGTDIGGGGAATYAGQLIDTAHV